MRRPITLGLLAFGTIAGYASGFHQLHCAREHRAAFERHVAQVCVDAARGAGNGDTRQEYPRPQ